MSILADRQRQPAASGLRREAVEQRYATDERDAHRVIIARW